MKTNTTTPPTTPEQGRQPVQVMFPMPESVSETAVEMTFLMGAKQRMGCHCNELEQMAMGRELANRFNSHPALLEAAQTSGAMLMNLTNKLRELGNTELLESARAEIRKTHAAIVQAGKGTP